MKFTKILASVSLATAAIALPGQAIAAQAGNCITHAEASALVVAMLPAASEQAVKTCAPLLPANSAINGITPERIAKFKAAAEPAKPAAGEAVKKAMGKDLPAALPGSAMLPMIEGLAIATMAEEMDKNTCMIVNNLWPTLAELSPQGIGGMVASLLSAFMNNQDAKGAKKKTPISDISICPYVATMPPVK